MSLLLTWATVFGKYLARRGHREIDLSIGEGSARPAIVGFVENVFVDSSYYVIVYLFALIPLLTPLLLRTQWISAIFTTMNGALTAAILLVIPVAYWINSRAVLEQMYDGAVKSGKYEGLVPREQAQREYLERTGQDAEIKIEF